MEKVTRRNFFGKILKTATFLSLAGIPGLSCIKDGMPPEIMLTGDSAKDAVAISKIYNRIEQIVKNPFDEIRIGWLNDIGDVEVVALSCQEDANKDNRVVLTNESTGVSSFLGFGIKGISPSIKFMDNKGEKLFDDNGNDMEYALLDFNDKGAPAKNLDATDWLLLGIKAVAIGFAVWLGAKVIGLIAGAIAFVAFNAMVIGLVIAGVVVLGAVAKWIVDKTGWNYPIAKNYFGKTVEDIKEMFQDIVLAVGG